MRVIFRTDASLPIGSGHLMRCLTLARALKVQGHDILFACREHPGHLLDWLQSEGIATLRLPLLHQQPANDLLSEGQPTKATPAAAQPQNNYADWLGASELQDAQALLGAIKAATLPPLAQSALLADWLVVDHYGLGAEFCRQLQPFCRHILQIDDLANRPYHCDLLLDQNLLPDADQRYRPWLSARCEALLGPRWALLRPEFAATTPARQLHAQVHQLAQPRILVFFGGSDPDNYSQLAITALQQLQKKHWLADIVIGQANPHRSLLQQLCAKDRRLTLHVQTPGMAGLMAVADLMLGAGGATHWERCSLALPALVVALADNQQATTRYLAELGACVDLGAASALTAQRLAQQLDALLAQPSLLWQLSAQAAQLVPAGGGVAALVKKMTQITAACAPSLPN